MTIARYAEWKILKILTPIGIMERDTFEEYLAKNPLAFIRILSF